MKKILFLLIFNICHVSCAFSQYNVSHLDLNENIEEWYSGQVGQLSMAKGRFQPPTSFNGITHPYYSSQTWITGTIKYRGISYTGIKMVYDLHKNYVLIQHPTHIYLADKPILLNQTQIEWFELEGIRFRFYEMNIEGFENVFFEERYLGDSVSLLTKRTKSKYLNQARKTVEFRSLDEHYLLNGANLIRIRNKRDVYNAFPLMKKELKKFSKFNNLSGTQLDSEGLISLVEKCDLILTRQ